MAKFNWRKLVSTVAPGLATALGGPLAGMAVKAISTGLLGKPDGTETEIEAALATATPADLLKLKEIDNTFTVEMKKLDIDIFKLETADVQSARAMYSVNYWPQITLSAIYVVGYFVMLGLLLGGQVTIPPEMKDMASVLIGVLTTAIPSILGFWFGSSYGSREKTVALAASSPADGR